MNQLSRTQDEFLACLLDDCAPLPTGWDARRAAGMAVYRNAYRSRLIDVLRNTFERTAKVAGDEAFTQAAAHHLIMHPPSSWTIDLAGEGFAETCTELFTKDPDVGELAWLEWAMHCAFTAANSTHMTLSDFASASASFDAGQWERLCLKLMPGAALRTVTSDIARLWTGLAESDQPSKPCRLDEPKWLLVWRDDELPVFGLVSDPEGFALAQMQRGIPFGAACAKALHHLDVPEATATAGAMLRNWFELGLIAEIQPSLLSANKEPTHEPLPACGGK